MLQTLWGYEDNKSKRNYFSVNGQKQSEQSSLHFSIQDFDYGCYYIIMWPAQQNPCHVCITTEFNFIIPAYRYTQWLPIPDIMLYVNWAAFLEGILLTLQSYDWNNGTNGGCQLGDRDLRMLPLLCGPLIRHGPLCGQLLASQLLQGYPNQSPLPISPIPFVSYTEIINGKIPWLHAAISDLEG